MDDKNQILVNEPQEVSQKTAGDEPQENSSTEDSWFSVT